MDSCPDEDLCKEADRGLSVSELDFFTLLPPLAGCLPFNDDTDITTSVETPSCSESYLTILLWNVTSVHTARNYVKMTCNIFIKK